MSKKKNDNDTKKVLYLSRRKKNAYVKNIQTLICDKCYNMIPLAVNFKLFYPVSKVKNSGLYLSFDVICPICNEMTYMYAVDPAIAGAVAIFNKMGYKTEYSCQGHIEVLYKPSKEKYSYDDSQPIVPDYNNPYIAIRGDKKMTKELESLLKKIHWDHFSAANDDGFYEPADSIVGKKNFAIYLSNDFIEKRIGELLETRHSKKDVTYIANTINAFFIANCSKLETTLLDYTRIEYVCNSDIGRL